MNYSTIVGNYSQVARASSAIIDGLNWYIALIGPSSRNTAFNGTSNILLVVTL